MKKISYELSLICVGLIIFFGSCINGNNSAVAPVTAETLPDDIVELRADQIELAKI
jgi:hypothetical protein